MNSVNRKSLFENADRHWMAALPDGCVGWTFMSSVSRMEGAKQNGGGHKCPPYAVHHLRVPGPESRRITGGAK
jgi:hypothetical protein